MGGLSSKPGNSDATPTDAAAPPRPSMKAAVYTEYGAPDVVEVKDVDKPTPKANEILVKIHVTTVSVGDSRVRSLRVPTGFGVFVRLIFGVFRPKNPILGTDLAGQVESVGSSVTKFKTGDRVFAATGMGMGGHAEYRCVREDCAVAVIPSEMSYEIAAATPFGGLTALTYLRSMAKVQPGEKVLVIGASGAVGSTAVQMAKSFGAQVTGVCSTANVDLVKSIGADAVIDYTKEDFTKNGEVYDVIMDNVGILSFSGCKGSLSRKGRLLLVAAGLPQMLTIPWVAMTSTKRVFAGPADESPEDIRFLADLVEAGKLKPVIGHRFPLERIVEAHVLADSGHKQGNIVIAVV